MNNTNERQKGETFEVFPFEETGKIRHYIGFVDVVVCHQRVIYNVFLYLVSMLKTRSFTRIKKTGPRGYPLCKM